MVEPSNSKSSAAPGQPILFSLRGVLTVHTLGSDVKFNAATFVAQNAGKLRDYYRIGKMLGSGKPSL